MRSARRRRQTLLGEKSPSRETALRRSGKEETEGRRRRRAAQDSAAPFGEGGVGGREESEDVGAPGGDRAARGGRARWGRRCGRPGYEGFAPSSFYAVRLRSGHWIKDGRLKITRVCALLRTNIKHHKTMIQ